jgi:uncharacterized protein (TIGR00661 family)
MKILYGVQGTGNGHLARARVMAKALRQRDDLQVDFLMSGRPPEKYFDMELFGKYQTFEGLTFVTTHGAIDKWQTYRHANIVKLIKDIRTLDLSQYDLVLNDFEPISAWAAKIQFVPCISISHQAAFSFPVPKKGDSIFDRLLTRYFAPGDVSLGVHWYHFGHAIMPPFIEEEVDIAASCKHYLVYLPFEDPKAINELLSNFKEYSFECFHPEISMDTQQQNILWRRVSKPNFRDSIINCAGVVANAGFELSSECLKLGKKSLIKPLKGQYEQLSNVHTLELLGLCDKMTDLNAAAMKAWLAKGNPCAIRYPTDPSVLIDWLVEQDWHDTQQICETLWRNVVFPEDLQKRLDTLSIPRASKSLYSQ